MANGHLNVANDFVSENVKNRMFWVKIRNFLFNSHFSAKNNKRGYEERWPRMLVYVLKIHGMTLHLKVLCTLKCVLKMWRMDIFIRHICGERKNIVGHRCIRVRMDGGGVNWFQRTVMF